MLLRLPWLAAATQPAAHGFFSALAPVIGMGIGALGNWFGGRSQSKQHQRQLASEERRQMMMMQAQREWMQAEQERRAQWQQDRQARIRQAGEVAGIRPELIELAASTPGRMPPMIPPGGMQQAMPTAGVPQSQPFDFMRAGAALFGPQPDTVADVEARQPPRSDFFTNWALANRPQLEQMAGGFARPTMFGGGSGIGPAPVIRS